MAVTLHDVGRRAGVSAMTVSRVINGGAGVDAETQRKVEEAIAALDYVPNRIARGLLSQKTQTDRPDRARRRQPVLRAGGARRRDRGQAGRLPRAPLQQRGRPAARARVHRGPGRAPGRGPAAGAGQRPLAARDLPAAARRLPVGAPRPRAARRRLRPRGQRQRRGRPAAGRASDRGRPPRHRASHRRRRRLDRARPAARLPRGARRRRACPTATTSSSGPRSTGSAATAPRSRCWRSTRCPTAIFAVNNMTAVGAMQALRERGLSVPDDMALVCFDDVEHLAVLSPFLTVIDQPAETLGSLGGAAPARAHRRQGRASGRAASCCRPTSSSGGRAGSAWQCRSDRGQPQLSGRAWPAPPAPGSAPRSGRAPRRAPAGSRTPRGGRSGRAR